MNQTSVSQKGQVVIPVQIRHALNITPNSRLQVTLEEDKIIMVPLPDIDQIHGMFKLKGKISEYDIKSSKRSALSKKFDTASK